MRKLMEDGRLVAIPEVKTSTPKTGKKVADVTKTGEYSVIQTLKHCRNLIPAPAGHPVLDWGLKALADGHPVVTGKREARASR